MAVHDTRNTTLQSVLKQLLTNENLTANGLATKLNLPTPTIHRLLTGEVKDPRLSTMTLVANYFDITIEQLIGRQPLNKKISQNGKMKMNTRKRK